MCYFLFAGAPIHDSKDYENFAEKQNATKHSIETGERLCVEDKFTSWEGSRFIFVIKKAWRNIFIFRLCGW